MEIQKDKENVVQQNLSSASIFANLFFAVPHINASTCWEPNTWGEQWTVKRQTESKSADVFW